MNNPLLKLESLQEGTEKPFRLRYDSIHRGASVALEQVDENRPDAGEDPFVELKQLTRTYIKTQFEARSLTVNDAEELRAVRLESLRYYGPMFDKFYKENEEKPIEYWRQLCTETDQQSFFGLFYRGKLVGVNAARKWEERPDMPIAFGWGNFLLKEYRGLGVAGALYKARLRWARDRGFEKLVVYVLDGKTRPAELLVKHGAKYIFTRQMRFAEGPEATWHWYEIPLMGNKAAS